jgi:nucleoside-diphosphate-sugar epimerase
MKKISIIGGAGFIGHNLALALNSLGFSVNIIDNLQINNLGSLVQNKNNLPYPELSRKILNERIRLLESKGIELFKIDAKDNLALKNQLKEIEPNIIIHLAAVSHANISNKDPHTTFDNSLRTLENALDYAKNKVDHFIYSSSSMVYGNFESAEVNEETKCDPIGIYGTLKYAGEKMIKAYNQVFNLPYTIIRPSALYGERCISRRVGQIFIESALHKKEIIINGDGNEKLDFTYIDDLIEGFIKVIENKKSINEIFNITYGNARSINEMIEILSIDFPEIKVQKEKRDKLTPIRGTLSTKKAKNLIDYNPKWSLENGYPKYIEWYKEVFNS